jgi:hypothetical protein
VLREWQARQFSRRYNTRSLIRLAKWLFAPFEEASTLPAARCSEQQGGRRQRHADHSGGFDRPGVTGKPHRHGKDRCDSVDDCTDESVMEFLESTQERDASVTAEFVKAEVLAKVTFAMSEKDPALRVMKAVADYYSLHRNQRLDFINGKPKKAVEHLVSVIRPATLKALIESELGMDKSELKKDFLEFVKYLEEMRSYTTSTVMLWNTRRLATLA